MIWDNCCTCPPPQPGQAVPSRSVRAIFRWPGWPLIGTSGFHDNQGQLFLSYTVTVELWDNGWQNFDFTFQQEFMVGVVTFGITVDPLNGTPSSVVGPANGTAILRSIPGDARADSGMSLRNATFTQADPLDGNTVKFQCLFLLGQVDLLALHPGQFKFVHYDYGTGTVAAQNAGNPPPSPSIAPSPGSKSWYWIWGDPFTRDPITGNVQPFKHVPPAIIIENDPGSFFGQNGLGYTEYEQETGWVMAKSLWEPTGSPGQVVTACYTDEHGDDHGGTPDTCQILQDDGNGHLIVNPADLAFDITNNGKFIQTSATIGAQLTNGGCPCHL